MKIAFVGKGGSGKTTLSGLFGGFLDYKQKNVLMIDADINIHLPSLTFGDEYTFPKSKYLSDPKNVVTIKKYLKYNNTRIKNLGSFRKTTPPAEGSKLFFLDDYENMLYKKFSEVSSHIQMMVVGTYSSEDIGASCYHNNLAILENLLTHMDDNNGICVVDMVAGVDAFAGSLYNQFDIIVLVVEPTKKSLGIWESYSELAKHAGMYNRLFVCANKIYEQEDFDFVKKSIPSEKIIGSLGFSKYLKNIDRDGAALDFSQLEEENQLCLNVIFSKLKKYARLPDERLDDLYAMHRKYVAQDFIIQRYGDLTNQIDPNFKF